MVDYRIFTGELPELEIVQSNGVHQIFYQFEEIEVKDEDGEVDSQKHCTCNMVEVRELDYESIVSAIVRDKYSQNDVEAIISNYQLCKDGKAGEDRCIRYEEDYNAYQDYRAMAKQVAMDVLNK